MRFTLCHVDVVSLSVVLYPLTCICHTLIFCLYMIVHSLSVNTFSGPPEESLYQKVSGGVNTPGDLTSKLVGNHSSLPFR